MVAGVWQDDTAWALWQDQWDKGDEYALNMLAVHCPKCPAKFVNNIYVRDGISCTLAGPAAFVFNAAMLGQVGGAVLPVCDVLRKVKATLHIIHVLVLRYKAPRRSGEKYPNSCLRLWFPAGIIQSLATSHMMSAETLQ